MLAYSDFKEIFFVLPSDAISNETFELLVTYPSGALISSKMYFPIDSPSKTFALSSLTKVIGSIFPSSLDSFNSAPAIYLPVVASTLPNFTDVFVFCISIF